MHFPTMEVEPGCQNGHYWLDLSRQLPASLSILKLERENVGESRGV